MHRDQTSPSLFIMVNPLLAKTSPPLVRRYAPENDETRSLHSEFHLLWPRLVSAYFCPESSRANIPTVAPTKPPATSVVRIFASAFFTKSIHSPFSFE